MDTPVTSDYPTLATVAVVGSVPSHRVSALSTEAVKALREIERLRSQLADIRARGAK